MRVFKNPTCTKIVSRQYLRFTIIIEVSNINGITHVVCQRKINAGPEGGTVDNTIRSKSEIKCRTESGKAMIDDGELSAHGTGWYFCRGGCIGWTANDGGYFI